MRSQAWRPETAVRPETGARQAAASKEYRAALDALFEKKPEAVETVAKFVPAVTNLPRVVETEVEASGSKRQDLLRRIANAQGSRAISDAIEAFLRAGFELPDDQELFLQMLEHRDEGRVREAMVQLDRLLAGQPPKRKPVLLQRLKRLEENAEESATRDAAATLRRKLT